MKVHDCLMQALFIEIHQVYIYIFNFFYFVAERRCDGLAVFVKEENKRLGGPFEVDYILNVSLDDCQAHCLRAEK